MKRCKFYFSAIHMFRQKASDMGITGFNELLSYYEILKTKMTFEKINEISKERGDIMIDSGAYSAFTQKKPINIQNFIAWHKDLAQACPQITYKAGLDDIGSPEQSIVNQRLTDEAGLKLFPTYHRMDPFSTLQWIKDSGYKQMGFGGLAGGGLTEADKITDWIEEAFSHICDEQGEPTIDVHLFGVSNVEIIHQFPPYSNDSAAALFTGGWGAVWLPNLHPQTHQPMWEKPMCRLAISKESPSQANPNQHYHSLRPGQKQVIADFMESQGFKVQDIIDDYESRCVFTLVMQKLQSENYPDGVKFKRRMKEFDIFA